MLAFFSRKGSVNAEFAANAAVCRFMVRAFFRRARFFLEDVSSVPGCLLPHSQSHHNPFFRMPASLASPYLLNAKKPGISRTFSIGWKHEAGGSYFSFVFYFCNAPVAVRDGWEHKLGVRAGNYTVHRQNCSNATQIDSRDWIAKFSVKILGNSHELLPYRRQILHMIQPYPFPIASFMVLRTSLEE